MLQLQLQLQLQTDAQISKNNVILQQYLSIAFNSNLQVVAISKQHTINILTIFILAQSNNTIRERKMLADKLASVRQSLEMKGSAKTHATRDSGRAVPDQYSIDVELSDNNKKMLEVFKQNSGFYNMSPKKIRNGGSPQKKPLVGPSHPIVQEPKQVPRLYLFGNKEGDYTQKAQAPSTSLSPPSAPEPQKLSIPSTCPSNPPSIIPTLRVSQSDQKHIDFLKQIFDTLGLSNENDCKLQFPYLLDAAYTRFIDMKSNGRWALIYKYFKGVQEEDLGGFGRSIIKKKSMVQLGGGEKKRVKVVEPETASQLIRTKFSLAQQLQSHIQYLTKGFVFHKYNYSGLKITETAIFLSYDLKCLAWKTPSSSSPSSSWPQVQDMSNFSGITDGLRSKNFHRYIQKHYKIDQQLAFSVVLKDRTLDFVAKCFEDKMKFVEGVKFVRGCL